MGLAQQLITLLSLLLMCAFGGSFVLGVSQAKDYFNQQLGVHAQDTATALAVALAPALAKADQVAAESMLEAISDGGFFSSVRVEARDGQMLAERVTPLRVEGVPSWFIQWIALDMPVKEAAVQDGWRVNGRVRVASNTGYAYQRLWHDTAITFWWFAASWAALCLVAFGVVRLALKPLDKMQAQAVAISDGKFRVLEDIPYTRDLRHIAQALNTMSKKVEGMFKSKLDLIRKIEQEAILDPLTGALNRTHFESRVHAWLQQEEAFAHGGFFIVRLSGLAEYNSQHGYEAGNELLRQTADHLAGLAERLGECLVGRLSGAELGLAVSGLAPDEAKLLGIEISQRLYSICIAGLSPPLAGAHVGVGFMDRSTQTVSTVFAEADMALRKAELKSHFGWHAYEPRQLDGGLILGASSWRRLLTAAIELHGFRLYSQPVVACTDRTVLHHEILARLIQADGALIPAGIFMPMARRLGLAPEIDWLLISKGLARIDTLAGTRSVYSFNLSLDTLREPAFIPRLSARLHDKAALAPNFCFEVSERALSAVPFVVQELMARLRPLGVRFGLDQVGSDSSTLHHLKSLRFDFIKLDGTLLPELEKQIERKVYVRTLCDFAHDVECQVIATGVESEAQLALACELGVDAVQGKAIGEPAPMREL